jgi:hypothetical protein
VQAEHIVVDAHRVELDEALHRAEDVEHGAASYRTKEEASIFFFFEIFFVLRHVALSPRTFLSMSASYRYHGRFVLNQDSVFKR